jgi:hypothetical protein
MAGDLKLKFTFCFMQATHEPLRLDKRRLAQRKIMDNLQVLFELLLSLTKASKYGDGAKF